MPRMSQPVTVTLGPLRQFVDQQVERGNYASASEVVRAGLRALERQEAAVDDWMRAKIEESLNDPRPDIPAEEVFAELRARNAARRAVDAERK
ncbi:type II toxin-antitoxin system ParD family antitoxin [Phenylobacterium sp.]|uniref:type II toxin-antitoxin system ParD family antitoxin n=1 Tax=Phenylobacterium sp. TaxID=1871053 RepID=UPI002C0E6F8E|nr:type II toxin-antitoxin system ParD family antitoxin [Phenylobacterium sp.]HLZ76141.1 type II toxin-antitoxin system ParD family antitoxin [Phenylobacterium sp.]